MLVLNDLHAGFARQGGTTPASREALRSYLLNSIDDLIGQTDEKHLVVAGDFFDDFEVDTRDWVDAWKLCMNWLCRADRKLTLIAGNHDVSPRGNKVSSFFSLATVLVNSFPAQVEAFHIGEHGYVSDSVYTVAHCANQDLFEMALRDAYKACEAQPYRYLVLHANYDNGFAAESDHSLNVTSEAAAEFDSLGVTLLFAHEHQARRTGNVVVFGNQFPTSVSDCLGNDFKFAHVIDSFGSLLLAQTWGRDDEIGGYVEMDWRDLGSIEQEGFVRVSGTASASEAPAALQAIASYRQRSKAFVVVNGVRVEGIAEVGDLPASFEAAKAFDVMAFVRKHLEADELAVVEKLLP